LIDPVITCPSCNAEIKLTESLAAPLIEATKAQYEKQFKQINSEIAEREKTLNDLDSKLKIEKQELDKKIQEEVSLKVIEEKTKIGIEEKIKARNEISIELEGKAKELQNLEELLKSKDLKLAEAQKTQADLLRKQRELDDEKRELDLTVEKKIQAGLEAAKSTARKEAEDHLKFKVLEKDQTITSMQKTIEELKRKAEQGSQQLQGEVQELELENTLKSKFPYDNIEPVPKGEFGGDVLQRVVSLSGQFCGTIIWESKRTKSWSDAWLAKLRDDQRTAKAEIAIIVTQVLPKGVETFDLIDGVWVTSPKSVVPLAMILRNSLTDISNIRQISEGQATKTEMIYQYLTGPRFKHRVEAIVEAFTTLQDDLDTEKKLLTKQWAKRQTQIERVMNSTVGMYGDLQGIAGKSFQEIEGLEFKQLLAPD
jgi:hypothetical protein